jgi:putative SOS response-associated peptidase YedK
MKIAIFQRPRRDCHNEGDVPRRLQTQSLQPYYFTRCDGALVTIAGLWDQWRDRTNGERIQSATMIISEPNAFVSEVHDRMPVLLEEKDFESWLSTAGIELLKPAPDGILQRWPVSKRVNSSRPDPEDPTLIDAVVTAATAVPI